MKKFAFSLQAVYVLRQREEATALRAYSQSLTALKTAISNFENAERLFSNACAQAVEIEARPVSASEIHRFREYVTRVGFDRTRMGNILKNARHLTAEALQKTLLTRQQRQAIEKLHERQFGQWSLAQQRDEQKFLDELATSRFESSALLESEAAV